MKTNYKHTHWLRTAALRVITLMAFLTVLPGFAKAQNPAGPLNVSDMPANAQYAYSFGKWSYYDPKIQSSLSFNGTILGSGSNQELKAIQLLSNDANPTPFIFDNVDLTITEYGVAVEAAAADKKSIINLKDSKLSKTVVNAFASFFYSTSSNVLSLTTIQIDANSTMDSEVNGRKIIQDFGNTEIKGGTTYSLNMNSISDAISMKSNYSLSLSGLVKIYAGGVGINNERASTSITLEKGVQIASKNETFSQSTQGINSPVIQWSYLFAPASGTLTVKDKTNTVVATFNTDGSMKNFAIPVEIDNTYTLFYTKNGGSEEQVMDKDKTSTFSRATNGVQKYEIKPAQDWTYTNGKLTRTEPNVELSAQANGDKELTITGITSLTGTEIDLSGVIGNEDGSTQYVMSSIATNSFKGKDLTKLTLPVTVVTIADRALDNIKELHLQAETAITVNATAFSTDLKEKGLLFVPVGKLETYKNAEGWKAFRYIAEEGKKYYDVTFTKLENLECENYQPLYAIEGQKLTFTLKGTGEYGIPSKITAKKGDANANPDTDYTFKDGTFTSKDNASTTWSFEASGVSIIKPDGGKDIIIKDNNNYTEGTTDKEYATMLDGNGKIITKLTVGDNTTAEDINILFKDVAVVAAALPGTYSTTVDANATATISLQGFNSLGTLLNNGTLTFEPAKDKDGKVITATLTATIENKKTFIDYTALVPSVTGAADMTIKQIGSVSIPQGGKQKLTVEASTTGDKPLEYKWQQLSKEGIWGDIAQPQLLKDATPGNVSEITQPGTYRCLISTQNTDGTVNTTLTSIANVYTENPVQYHDVILPKVEGATTNPVPGTYSVAEYDYFWFTLTLNKGYEQSKPVVIVDDKEIKIDTSGRYVIDHIYNYTEIKINGVKPNPAPVGINGADKADAKAWSENGTLYVHTPTPQHVTIYTVAGALYKDLGTVSGDTQVMMQKGIYIVVIGDKSTKIIM